MIGIQRHHHFMLALRQVHRHPAAPRIDWIPAFWDAQHIAAIHKDFDAAIVTEPDRA